MNNLKKSFSFPFMVLERQRNHWHKHFCFGSQKSFQNQIGLKNKITLMGKVKRFERRKPKIARVVRFQLIFLFFGLVTLSLIPGSQLPFQKRLKLSIFHTKSWFNYYWNYQIGKEKEKYVYLLLEDLLAQMNNHQIYSVQEISRVFQEVDRLLQDEYETIKTSIEHEIRLSAEDKYIDSSKDQNKLNVKKENSKIQNSKQVASSRSESVQTSVKNKKNELKQKLKSEIDNKYKVDNLQQSQEKSEESALKVKSQSKKQEIKESTKKSSLPIEKQKNTSQINEKSNQKLTNQIDLKKILQNSFTYSPSFNYNMLMYHVLILQNVIRYETKLLKDSRFYEVYQKAVQNFIFNDKVQKLLAQKIVDKNQSYKGQNQNLERQIVFLKVLRSSIISAGISKNKSQNALIQGPTSNDQGKIDPHKLLTYLINYRHLMDSQEKSLKQDNKPLDESVKEKDSKVKELLVNYMKMIGKDTLNNHESKNNLDKIVQGLGNENKMIELAISNKQFINSLKQLYIESKKTQEILSKDIQRNSKIEKNRNKLNAKLPQTISSKQLETLPIYKIIESIFTVIDQYFQAKSQPLKKKEVK